MISLRRGVEREHHVAAACPAPVEHVEKFPYHGDFVANLPASSNTNKSAARSAALKLGDPVVLDRVGVLFGILAAVHRHDGTLRQPGRPLCEQRLDQMRLAGAAGAVQDQQSPASAASLFVSSPSLACDVDATVHEKLFSGG